MLKALLDMLSENRNHFIDMLARMQANGHPIVLCGAGYVAQITWDFMQRQGMPVDYVAISDAWLKSDAEFNGQRIVGLESLMAQESKYNYIIASLNAMPARSCFTIPLLWALMLANISRRRGVKRIRIPLMNFTPALPMRGQKPR